MDFEEGVQVWRMSPASDDPTYFGMTQGYMEFCQLFYHDPGDGYRVFIDLSGGRFPYDVFEAAFLHALGDGGIRDSPSGASPLIPEDPDIHRLIATILRADSERSGPSFVEICDDVRVSCPTFLKALRYSLVSLVALGPDIDL